MHVFIYKNMHVYMYFLHLVPTFPHDIIVYYVAWPNSQYVMPTDRHDAMVMSCSPLVGVMTVAVGVVAGLVNSILG